VTPTSTTAHALSARKKKELKAALFKRDREKTWTLDPAVDASAAGPV